MKMEITSTNLLMKVRGEGTAENTEVKTVHMKN